MVKKLAKVSSIVFAFALVAALAMPGAFLVESPGPALNVEGTWEGKKLVSLPESATYPSESELLMTTVAAQGNADMGMSGAGALLALFHPQMQLIDVRALYPAGVSGEEAEQEDLAMMSDSQNTAAAVAFGAIGKPSAMKLIVSGVPEDSPSQGLLQAGDVIRAITTPEAGQRKIASFADLSQTMWATEPGTKVHVTVERADETLSKEIVTSAYEADTTGYVHPGSQLGILIAVSDVKLPEKVTYAVEGIGGPSAGMMFALGIYDQLTPGSLAGNKKVAGTGTIAYNGLVGPIGGIVHKMHGAAEEGARYFLSPADNCAEAVTGIPEGMKVFAVRNFDDALAATLAIGAEHTSDLLTCQGVVEEAAAAARSHARTK